MSWFFLVVAIALEVAGTVCMKLSKGCTEFWPSAGMLGLYALGLGAMALALRDIDVSVAYAIWAGVGLALVAVVGMWWFEEPVSLLKMVSLVLIVLGVAGLNYTERKQPASQEPATSENSINKDQP